MKPINCVIYARYSSDNQREESIEGQIRECKEYAERHNMTVLSSYIDRARSAVTDDRPEFQKMIRDSAKKQFDVVLVWKLDRFSRNRFDSATYRAILKRNGVKVVSAKENISDGPEGIILEAMLDGMAEYYSAELSVKVKRGQKENALKCKANGGTIPFGYIINADRYYEIDPLTAPTSFTEIRRYGCLYVHLIPAVGCQFDFRLNNFKPFFHEVREQQIFNARLTSQLIFVFSPNVTHHFFGASLVAFHRKPCRYTGNVPLSLSLTLIKN